MSSFHIFATELKRDGKLHIPYQILMGPSAVTFFSKPVLNNFHKPTIPPVATSLDTLTLKLGVLSPTWLMQHVTLRPGFILLGL